MKKFVLLTLSILLSVPLFAQFKGKMVFTTMNKERHFDVHSSDAGYRYDFDEDGQKGSVIVKSGSQEVILLMPQQKMAMKSPAGSQMSMSSDPLKSMEYYQESGIMKKEGTESINGVKCTKSTLWNKDNPTQKMFTMWFSDKYKFPMKMLNHIDGSADSGMEMRDVEPWTADKNFFEIPAGYQVMEMPVGMPGQ
ncbi:MAG: hypothetical protein ACP5D9_07905 [Mariniphaga sp.]